MVVVTDQSHLHLIHHSAIRHLVAIRLKQLGDEATRSTQFIVVEPGDSFTAIEEAAGFPILTSMFDDLPFNHSDYTPPFEIMEEHHYEQHRVYEMVFISNDDGAATALLVPAEEGIAGDLLALCKTWATPVFDPEVKTP